MGLTSTRSITCDCCTFVMNPDTDAYTTVTTRANPIPGTSTLPAITEKYFCSVKGCDAGLATSVAGTIASVATIHSTAPRPGGVIPPH